VCYVWDLYENEVTIYDPLMCEVAANNSIGVHTRVVSKLGVAMDQCAKFFSMAGNNRGSIKISSFSRQLQMAHQGTIYLFSFHYVVWTTT
jgi:hypothetical protein